MVEKQTKTQTNKKHAKENVIDNSEPLTHCNPMSYLLNKTCTNIQAETKMSDCDLNDLHRETKNEKAKTT